MFGFHDNKKMEERGEYDPKFDIKNKTDRKILFTIIISIAVLLVLIAGCIALYLSGWVSQS